MPVRWAGTLKAEFILIVMLISVKRDCSVGIYDFKCPRLIPSIEEAVNDYIERKSWLPNIC